MGWIKRKKQGSAAAQKSVTDYSVLSWNDLRTLCAARGLKCKNKADAISKLSA